MHETLVRHRDQLLGQAECFDLTCLPELGRGISPALVEKAVHAFEYIGQLAQSGIAFVFTGGTAAQLLLAGGSSRLSKDVDVIALSSDSDDWRRVVAAIAGRFGGEVYAATEERREHGGLEIPAMHFVVSYPTMYPSGALPDIELDVVFAGAHFPLQDTDLRTRLYQPKSLLSVRTPTVEGLFGGKLTTLGPGTIGIPRGKANFDLAVGKQLFDLRHLLSRVRDVGAVASSYLAAFEQQIRYHPADARPTLEATLADALYALKLLSAAPGMKGPNSEWSGDLAQLSQAAVKLRGYVGDNEQFDRVGARQAASRVALMLVLVRKVLVEHLPPDDALTRWEAHTARIARDRLDHMAVKAAQQRLRAVPWAERPHLHLKEFVQTVGPEALLCWDAALQELLPA
ncbi:MAG: nucleotidyl transferase AbiEii/AbiGii toxin family protein [Chloroflexi bacterium]|nr:nucleotidyl transferase AbiEii/AbiGii toxin family protein [Chloroflexota bacterium]